MAKIYLELATSIEEWNLPDSTIQKIDKNSDILGLFYLPWGFNHLPNESQSVNLCGIFGFEECIVEKIEFSISIETGHQIVITLRNSYEVSELMSEEKSAENSLNEFVEHGWMNDNFISLKSILKES